MEGTGVKKLCLVLALLIPLGSLVFASNNPTKLIWLPSTSSDVAGYKLYCGLSSATYTIVKDIGMQTPDSSGMVNYLLENILPPAQENVWYCTLKAYDAVGNISGYATCSPPVSGSGYVCSTPNEIKFPLDYVAPAASGGLKAE